MSDKPTKSQPSSASPKKKEHAVAETNPSSRKKLNVHPAAKKDGSTEVKDDMIVQKPTPPKAKAAPAATPASVEKGSEEGEPPAPPPASVSTPEKAPVEPTKEAANKTDADGAVVMPPPERRIPIAIIIALVIALILLAVGYMAYTTSQDGGTTSVDQADATAAETDQNRGLPVGQTDIDEELDDVDGLLEDLDDLGELEDGLGDSSLDL